MKRHRIAAILAATLAAASAGCAAPAPRESPPPDRLTLQEEIALGRAAAPAVASGFGGEWEHLAGQAYVRTVGQQVARATRLSDLPYRFAVLDAEEPRGLALPGGVIYLTRGLLRRLETEAQLAAALSRQLAHLAAGHVRRTLTDRFSPAVLRRAAAGEVPADGSGDPQAARRIARVIRDSSYEADAQREADCLGLDYLAAAGYNPAQMADYLERIGAPRRHLQRIRAVAERKYAGRRGRIADDVYRREVLDRLNKP